MPSNQAKNLISRPPVVVVMGHIDHGKSTLLDYIRKSNVVAGEAGGITQHMGAYQAEVTSADGRKHIVTFLDTPGHEAFCNIRERGAKVADLAVLVVSAEDGVKPQTLEAYGNIKDAKMPFIVAIAKIDKPNANVEKAKQSLGENEIYVEGWGGDVPCVPISAQTGQGMSELLDMIVLVSELAELKTDPSASPTGSVIESSLDNRKGVSATLLVKDGLLHSGSFVVSGGAYAPVRFIEDFKGDKIEEATAGMPVKILGWTAIPACGESFIVVATKKEAERLSSANAEKEKTAMAKISNAKIVNAKSTQSKATNGNGQADSDIQETPQIVVLPLVIKADAIGSLDGVKRELGKIKHEKVELKIVSEGIGPINENDIKLAESDRNIVTVGFNAEPERKAAAMIERSAVPMEVRNFSIIYELTDFVRQKLVSKIPKEYVEETTGKARILAVFSKDKDRQVVGGKVETGILASGNEVKITRRETEIGRGKIRELQSKKVRVQEVTEGFEFGMLVEAKVEIAVGDKVEAVRTVEKK